MRSLSRSHGRIYVPDERDKTYQLDPRQSTLKRKTWYCSKALDQRDTPHCVGYAWNAWFTASPVRQNPISPEGIYVLSKHYDGLSPGVEGTTIRAAAKLLQITGHISSYKWCWTSNTAINWLLTQGPLVVGTNWYEGMDRPDKEFLSLSGDLVGGHAYLAYGVDVEDEYIRIHNSWSPLWGKKGKAKIRFSDFNRLLQENGECCAAVEIKR